MALRVQRTILLLRHFFVDRQPIKSLLQPATISQATLYRLVQTWETHGMAGLWPPLRANGPAQRAKPTLLDGRRIVATWQRKTTFALGCLPDVQHLLSATPDPAERGRQIAATLPLAIQATDAAIGASHGPPDLLARHIQQGQTIHTIAHDSAWSSRQISRYLQHAYQHLVDQLVQIEPPFRPAWQAYCRTDFLGRAGELATLTAYLSTSTSAGITGFSGVGKSTLIATLAAQWARAGWNIIWYQASGSAPDHTAHAIGAIHQQLAALGVASEPSPDVQQSTAEHIAWLNQALDQLPILVVLDNVQIGGEQPAWGAFLAQIAQGWHCSRLLLSGRTLPTRLDNTLLLHGLDEGAARTFYTQTWRPTSDAEWATIYRLSHGIPALLALIDAPTPASRIMPETARRLLHDSLSTFEANERAVLIWLSWWEGPLRHDHPFVQLLRRGSALERLIQQHIVTLTNDHLAVHDSVRDHLQILVPAAEWAAGTQAVEVYAVAHQEWELAYRCAENRRDLGAQWRYSREMALHLERTQHTNQALTWWRRAQEWARQVDDSPRYHDAVLAEIECLLVINRASEALERVPRTLDTTAGRQWRYALLQFEAYRIIGRFAEAQALLMAAPLNAAPPRTVALLDRWRFKLGTLILAWYQDSDRHIWARFQQLARPPAGAPLTLRTRYYRVMVSLASSAGDFKRSIAASTALIKLMQRHGSPYGLAEARITLSFALYSSERYSKAERRLSRVSKLLNPTWLWLRREAAKYRSQSAYALGDFQQAAHWGQITGDINRELGIHATDPWWMDGMLMIACGQHAAANEYFGQIEHSGTLSSFDAISLDYWQVVRLLQQGAVSAAQARLDSMLERILRSRFRTILPVVRLLWDDRYAAQGRLAKALHHCERAQASFARQELPISQAEALGRASDYLRQLGRGPAALAASARAIALLENQPPGLLAALPILVAHAQALAVAGQREAAAQAWAQARQALECQRQQLPAAADASLFLAKKTSLAILNPPPQTS